MDVSVRALVIVGILLGGGALLTSEGYAQSWQSSPDAQSEQKLPTERESSVERVPEWAEGKQRSSSRTQPSFENDVSTKNHLGGGDGVPVDGGLLWLVLAGGGYASWKLGLTTRTRRG